MIGLKIKGGRCGAHQIKQVLVKPAASPGGIQRYMSAEMSMSDDGSGSPQQGASARTGTSRQKATVEKATVAKPDGPGVTRPRSTGGSFIGGPKAQNGELKKKGGYILPVEEEAGSEELHGSMPLFKEALAEMLAKIEISLKTDIAAVRADIGQVLGQVEERLDMHDQILEGMGETDEVTTEDQ